MSPCLSGLRRIEASEAIRKMSPHHIANEIQVGRFQAQCFLDSSRRAPRVAGTESIRSRDYPNAEAILGTSTGAGARPGSSGRGRRHPPATAGRRISTRVHLSWPASSLLYILRCSTWLRSRAMNRSFSLVTSSFAVTVVMPSTWSRTIGASLARPRYSRSSSTVVHSAVGCNMGLLSLVGFTSSVGSYWLHRSLIALSRDVALSVHLGNCFWFVITQEEEGATDAHVVGSSAVRGAAAISLLAALTLRHPIKSGR